MSETSAAYGRTKLSDAETAKYITMHRDNFELSHAGEQPQRLREEEDLRFQVPEEQWDEASKQARAGRTEGNVVILPRPMLSISKVDQPIRLVMNQAFQAKLGVNVHPVSEDATDDTAEVLQDAYRRIERDSDANTHRLWALDRAVKAGRGFYRVVVRPDEDGFNYGDLEVGIAPFLYQGCVYLDPTAQLPDSSDGEFGYITSWLPLKTAERRYKSARASQAINSGITWAEMQSQAPLWVRENTAGKAIQIAECYWKEHKDELLLILDDGRVVVDGVDKIPKGRKVVADRVRDRVTVWHCVTDGFDLLETPRKWLGKYIPIVPVLGRILQPFDEQRRIIGIIRNARDPQRFFNTSASTLMERMFMEPRTPWVGPEGFDKGREAEWAQANYRNIPVLKFAPTLIPGTQVPAGPPMRAQLDQTGMSIALMALQEATILCQDATAFFDPSLGKTSKQEESGRKVLALQGQGDAANGDWLQNLAVAMRYEALNVLDLIAPADKERAGVYDAPGRIMTVIGGEPEKARKVMLNRPFVMDPATGKPRTARRGEKGAKHYDLRSGARYGVSIEIGTSFKTRLQEGDESITRMIEADPTLLSVIGDIWFTFKDIPGGKQIAERLELLAQTQHPELFKKNDSPEQAAKKAAALEQQVQALTQQLGEAVQFVKTDQAKHQAQVQIEQLKTAAQVEIQRMKDATAITVAQIQAETKGTIEATKAQNEALATGIKAAHEARELEKDRQHAREMQHETLAHDVATEVARGDGMTRHTEQGHEAGQEHERETGQGSSRESSEEAASAPPAGGEA